MSPPIPESRLTSVLERAQHVGALGPGPTADHVTHSLAFAAAWETTQPRPPAAVLDLGTGGGIPGLVLAEHWADARIVLLDARLARVTFLTDALATLGWSDRVVAVHDRAEDYGKVAANRESVALVTARGFGPPATTAECGASLVEVGGLLLVSEPPVEQARWPAAPLLALGLADEGTAGRDRAHVRLLRKVAPTADRYPRRRPAQQRQPLWR